MASLFLDICLSDIPKERIKRASNGKAYVKVSVREMRAADDHGNDHYISVYVPKEERREGDKPIYIGRGKENKRENAPSNERANVRYEPQSQQVGDDLPF